MLVAIGGRSGTGKSSVAAVVAPRVGAMPGAMVLRSDVVRKQLLGREPTERLPPETYRREMAERVYGCMLTRGVLLRAGRTVVCDAVYGLGRDRQAIERVATDFGISFRGFWLEAPEPVLEARVAARTGDALRRRCCRRASAARVGGRHGGDLAPRARRPRARRDGQRSRRRRWGRTSPGCTSGPCAEPPSPWINAEDGDILA